MKKIKWDTKSPSQIKKMAAAGNYLEAALELKFKKEERDLKFEEVGSLLTSGQKKLLKMFSGPSFQRERDLITEINFYDSAEPFLSQNKSTMALLNSSKDKLNSSAHRHELTELYELFLKLCAGYKYTYEMDDGMHYARTDKEIYEALVRQYEKAESGAQRT